jgi:hypothetical protein
MLRLQGARGRLVSRLPHATSEIVQSLHGGRMLTVFYQIAPAPICLYPWSPHTVLNTPMTLADHAKAPWWVL